MSNSFIGGLVIAVIIVTVFLIGASMGIKGAESRMEREAVLTNHAEIINGKFKWKEPCK